MLVWEEKASSRSGVGILPKELVQKIAKCLTWPQVRWELRDDEKAFDPGIRTATGAYYPTKHPLEGRNIWLTLGYKF